MSEKKDPFEELVERVKGFAHWLADNTPAAEPAQPAPAAPAPGVGRVRPSWDTWATGFAAGYEAATLETRQNQPDPPAPGKTDTRPGSADVDDLVAFLDRTRRPDVGWTIQDIPEALFPLLSEEWNTWQADPDNLDPYSLELERRRQDGDA